MASADTQLVSYLLKIPLEMRWEIYSWILFDSEVPTCGHEKLPLILSSGQQVKIQGCSEPINGLADGAEPLENGSNRPDIIFSIIVNRQIYHEVLHNLFARDVPFCAGLLRPRSAYAGSCHKYLKNLLPEYLMQAAPSNQNVVRNLSFI